MNTKIDNSNVKKTTKLMINFKIIEIKNFNIKAA